MYHLTFRWFYGAKQLKIMPWFSYFCCMCHSKNNTEKILKLLMTVMKINIELMYKAPQSWPILYNHVTFVFQEIKDLLI